MALFTGYRLLGSYSVANTGLQGQRLLLLRTSTLDEPQLRQYLQELRARFLVEQ